MIKILLVTIGLLIGLNSIAQSRLDSLISLRKTDKLEGNLPTYYTPGYRDVAKEFQTTIMDAIKYYESKYSVQFNVKLLMLDSSQWIKEIYPYGFVFYSGGWIVMNTGMTYDQFKDVYGLESYYEQVDKELKAKKIDEVTMIRSIFKVYSIHELGHYFIGKLSKTKLPDNWTGEFSATYFSYEYFYNNQPKELEAFELFCRADKDYYLPKYSSLADFNERYARTGLENYLWYHSNFYFLVKSLYECQGKEFISLCEKEFPKNATTKFTTTEIIDILDKNCKGIVRKWVNELDAAPKK